MENGDLEKEQIGSYFIDGVFQLRGRGIVFSGNIVAGIVELGSYIHLLIKDESKAYRIIGVEGIRHSQPQKVNTGLLIECKDEAEADVLKQAMLNGTTANIWKYKK